MHSPQCSTNIERLELSLVSQYRKQQLKLTMQYTVSDQVGNQYGPVDFMTLKHWVSEGRVLPHSKITDNLSNLTLLASQMPELGLAAGDNQYQQVDCGSE